MKSGLIHGEAACLDAILQHLEFQCSSKQVTSLAGSLMISLQAEGICLGVLTFLQSVTLLTYSHLIKTAKTLFP